MTKRLATLATLSLLAACQTQFIEPELVDADDAREAAEPELSDLELKLQLTAEAGLSSSRRSSGACGAELCSSDLNFLDVYVSEVMADPTACTDATGEWIEVHNRTDHTVDLNGAILEDRSSGARSTLSNVAILAPHSYAVLGKGSSPCGVAVDGTFSSSIALNNDGDSLYLRRPDEGLIDIALPWGPAAPGVSFETSPMDGWRWLSAIDDHGTELATPYAGPEDAGYVRPLAQVPEGYLQITEVMGDPRCAYDKCEWIEVRNKAGVAVDLDGLTLIDGGGNEGAFDSIVIAPYERMIVGRYRAEDWIATHIVPDAFYGNVGINNDGEQLMLVDGERVLFSTPWFPAFANGASWEMDAWAYDAEDLASWTQATDSMGGDEFGTPRY